MPLFGPPNVEKMSAKGDVKGLIKALGYHKDPDIPLSASGALAEMGTGSIEPLIAALHDNDKTVQKSAAEVLVKIGSPAVDMLVKAAVSRKVDKEAIKVLNQLGEQAVMRAGQELLERFLRAGEDCKDAASALADVGPPLVDSLVSILKDPQTDQVCNVQGSMCFILAYNMERMPHYGELLKELAARIEMGISLQGLTAGVLGEIGDKRAVEPLLGLLSSQDDLTRWVAAGSLFSIGHPLAVEPLLSLLTEQDLLITGKGLTWVLIGDGDTVKPLLADHHAGKRGAVEVMKKLGWGKTARR